MNAYHAPTREGGGSDARQLGRGAVCRVVRRLRPPDRAPTRPRMAERYGAATTLPDWQARLVCGACGAHAVEMVVTGTTSPRG